MVVPLPASPQRRRERYHTDPEYRAKRLQKKLDYYYKHKEQSLQRYQEHKKAAMMIVSGEDPPKCVYCGCTDLRFLEYNDKTPNYLKADKPKGLVARHNRNKNLTLKIVYGKLDSETLSNLEIACRICNAWHYLKTKYGTTGHTIRWQQPSPTIAGSMLEFPATVPENPWLKVDPELLSE